MSVSGFLVPFPDLGAADLMSDHLEQEIQVQGPGEVLVEVSLPRTLATESRQATGTESLFARKKLEVLQREQEKWITLWSVTTNSSEATERVALRVTSAGALKCRVTNMSGIEGQFALACSFQPD